MQSTFGLEVHARVMALSCCVALILGSDSARVNEVAKLCRAVVRGVKVRGLRRAHAQGRSWMSSDFRLLSSDFRVRFSLCAMGELDQAFKGIWWMPWH